MLAVSTLSMDASACLSPCLALRSPVASDPRPNKFWFIICKTPFCPVCWPSCATVLTHTSRGLHHVRLGQRVI
ncbi:hypothetical protein GGS20DRAFT_544173 [Poronia punctata]|nr:hypothetical protein GGS20DRAFT_544173 [Poronia punctata]